MSITGVIIKTIIILSLTYWVYKDSEKNNIKHSNLWVLFTFLFPPAVIFYYIYKLTAGKKTKLSKRQIVEIEVKKRRRAELEKIARERSRMENAETLEKEQNAETLEELEAIGLKRKAEKEAKMKELHEERLEQQKENARLMKISVEAAKEKMHIEDK